MMNTKYLILFVILNSYLFAQSASTNDSLYQIAFEKYAVEIDSFYIKFSDDDTQYGTIMLNKSNIDCTFPNSINGRKVVELTDENRSEIYQQNNNAIIETRIFPFEIDGEFIKVTFIPYFGKLTSIDSTSVNYDMVLSDWTKVFFKYNCKL